MVTLWTPILLNVFALSLQTIGLQVVSGLDTDEGLSECLPQLADRCFSETYDKLACILKQETTANRSSSGSTSVKYSELTEFCSALDDSLDCSSDIIDTNCTVKNERTTFDLWLSGLREISSFLCTNVNDTLKVMADNVKCWNSTFFFDCVRVKTGISHIVDIMRSPLNLNECIVLVYGLSECNVFATLATPLTDSCNIQGPYVEMLTRTFLAKTNCNNNELTSRAHRFDSNFYMKIYLVFLVLQFIYVFGCI